MAIIMPIATTKSNAHGVQKQTYASSIEWKDIVESQNYSVDLNELKLNQTSTTENPKETQKPTKSLHDTPHIINLKQDLSSQEKSQKDTMLPTINCSNSDNKKLDKKQTHPENTEQAQPIAFVYTPSSQSTENISQNTEHNKDEEINIDKKNQLSDSEHSSKSVSIHPDTKNASHINSISENKKTPKIDVKISSKENFNEQKQNEISSLGAATAPERDDNIQGNVIYKKNYSLILTAVADNKPKEIQKNTDKIENIFGISETRNQKINPSIFIQSENIEKDAQLYPKKLDLEKDKNLQINPVADLKENFNASLSGIDLKTNTSSTVDKISLAPSALSANVVALHKSGQNSILLRLDPPNLGHLSIQIKMNPEGSVNVSFIPSSTDAAQTLLASLPQLNIALVQSGLSLGQTEIGGQFSQSGRQQNQQNMTTYMRKFENNLSEDSAPSVSHSKGLSFYA